MFEVPVANDAVIANIKFPISGIELRMPSLSKSNPERSLTLLGDVLWLVTVELIS